MNLILITILNTLLANYSEEVGYRWPEDELVTTKTLFFLTTDDLSVKQGDYECFILEDIGPYEVCGEVITKVEWLNDSTFVRVRVE